MSPAYLIKLMRPFSDETEHRFGHIDAKNVLARAAARANSGEASLQELVIAECDEWCSVWKRLHG